MERNFPALSACYVLLSFHWFLLFTFVLIGPRNCFALTTAQRCCSFKFSTPVGKNYLPKGFFSNYNRTTIGLLTQCIIYKVYFRIPYEKK